MVDLLNPEEKRSVSPITLAGIYANIGEKEKAIECLEKAYEEGSGYLRAINGDFVRHSTRRAEIQDYSEEDGLGMIALWQLDYEMFSRQIHHFHQTG